MNVATHISEEELALDSPKHVNCTAATRNACKLCTPLGACLAYKGIRGCIPFLHGSQGCATYIRRYLIGHFREPVDIAASNFSEEAAVFGGAQNLELGLANVTVQYQPEAIGLATTCLSETIGEDMPSLIHGARARLNDLPPLAHASTPSYTGSHVDGFHTAVHAITAQWAMGGSPIKGRVNFLPGMVSPEDLRFLRTLASAYNLEPTILPDYSDTLDGGIWGDYHKIPSGGTAVDDIRAMGAAAGSVEFGLTYRKETAGQLLEKRFSVKNHRLPLPIGVRATDDFLEVLEDLSGKPTPDSLAAERERLVDSFVDAHKIFGSQTAAVFGDPDLIIGLTTLLTEMGIHVVLCATGTAVKNFEQILRSQAPGIPTEAKVLAGTDFESLGDLVTDLKPAFLVGNSKGYKLSRQLQIPLIRTGFPIHDRMGGQRVLHLGYRGAQQLSDQIANTLLERRQDASEMGFTYY